MYKTAWRGGFILHIVARCQGSSSEKKRDAPNTCQTDKCINDAADKTGLTAEDPRNKIEAEKSDKTPIQRTDDAQKQCESIRKNPSYFSGGHSMSEFFGQYTQKSKWNL